MVKQDKKAKPYLCTIAKGGALTQRKVSYIERDRYEPSISDIIAFCRCFDVTADYLLGLQKRNSSSKN